MRNLSLLHFKINYFRILILKINLLNFYHLIFIDILFQIQLILKHYSINFLFFSNEKYLNKLY